VNELQLLYTSYLPLL